MDPFYKVVSLEDPLDIRQITFTNLRLLGFNPKAAEHKSRIPFDKDMFALPNKKGFEVVMHFLLNRLNPVRFREEFRDCFPVGDKKQEHQFRKACCDWLSQLAKEEDAKLPRINAALFMSPGGDKFYQLLHALSTHVIKNAVLTENGTKQIEFLRRPSLTPQNAAMEDALDHVLQCATSRERRRFLNHVQQGCSVQDYWRNYSTELVRDYRSLNRKVKDLERELKAEVQSLAQKGSAYGTSSSKRGLSEYEMEVGSVKRTEHVRRCREMWSNLEKFYDNISKERGILEDVLENNKNKYKLDATELNVRVPDLLLRECEQEIHQRNVNNIFEGGRLNLLSVIHLWNLSLHLYIEKLHQTGIPNFDKVMPSVSTQVHSHQAHLANAMALKKQLSEMLPDLKSSIDVLRKKMDSVLFHSKSPDSIRVTTSIMRINRHVKSVGLSLLPPTPPINFDLEGVSCKQDEVTKSLAMTPGMETNVSTPEGANALMDKIQRKVRADGASPLVQGSPVYGGRSITSNVANKNMNASKLPKYETRPESSQLHRKINSRKSTAFERKVVDKKASRKSVASWSPVTPTESSMSMQHKARQPNNDSMTSVRSTKPKSFKVPQSVPNQKIKRKVSSKSETPSAQDILADRIAEELLAASPRRQSLSRSKEEPFNLELALGNTAFESRDKLSRTPAKTPTSSWHETLMQRMEGPLSSTRVEHSSPASSRAPVKDKVVTKLFTDEDGYSDATDVGLSEVASTISATESRNLEVIEDEEDARVLELINSLKEEAKEYLDNDFLSDEKNEELADSISRTPVFSRQSSISKRQSFQRNFSVPDSPDDDNFLNEAIPLDSELLPADIEDVDYNYADMNIAAMTSPKGSAIIPHANNYESAIRTESSHSPVLPERLRSILSMSASLSSNVPGLDEDRTPELETFKRKRSLRNNKVETRTLDLDNVGDLIGAQESDTADLIGSHYLIGSRSIGAETLPSHDNESESDEADSQARIIEVQNGSYKETIEPSPSKAKSSVIDRLTSSYAPKAPPEIKPSLTNSTTSDLLARYKRLHMQMPMTDSLVQSALKAPEPLRSTETFRTDEMSPKLSKPKAPLSDIYLQRTPNKVVNRNKRSLAFESDEEEVFFTKDVMPSLSMVESKDPKPPRQPSPAPLKELNINISSFDSSPLGTPKKKDAPGLTFASMPLSPLTDVLHHNEGLTDMGSSKGTQNMTKQSSATRLKLLSILDEDESVLLPPSPNMNAILNSPLTANLLDI